ncbi:hypothetical protein Egran_01509, partial [Elaphomyces granulatus]
TLRKHLNAWIVHLEPYLPPNLKEVSLDNEHSDNGSDSENRLLHEGRDIAMLLWQARCLEDFDILGLLGFKLQRWPGVIALITKMLNSAEAFRRLSAPNFMIPSNIEWGSESLDVITGDSLIGEMGNTRIPSHDGNPLLSNPTLDTSTDGPFAVESSRMIMREVWQSLGFIILEAADLPADQSKLVMSFVYRILARLHHSGSIPDAVYKFMRPGDDDALFRPPGMYLLSTHIMNVLSDAAWLAHEAEVSNKAAATGEDSPFRPFKMGIRELGPEIWLEFVLWCCVEEGYIHEGAWILKHMKARKNNLSWNTKSWKPLLHHPNLIRDTNVDVEDIWRSPEDFSAERKLASVSRSFRGLGKRTISAEVIVSLMYGAADSVQWGVGSLGYSTGSLLQDIAFLNSIIAADIQGAAVSPCRYSHWTVARFLESRDFEAHADPSFLERLLRTQPPTALIWNDVTATASDELQILTKPQLYDNSAALTGLLEFNLRLYAAHRHISGALGVFRWLQELIDLSKLQHIGQFLEEIRNEDLSFDCGSNNPVRLDHSSIPQLSNVAFANILDLATTSRAFSFGEWLLFSEDVDGRPIPDVAYGDQCLTPSIIRFAAATRNADLCSRAMDSLSDSVSRNTLKALLNFRITMGAWDQVVLILEYLRDHKAKSWGDSNITALAATVLRLDLSVRNRDRGLVEETQFSLSRAKDILKRLLSGEYNTLSNPANHTVYQERALYRLYEIFASIPGPLEEICSKTDLKYQPLPRDVLPPVSSVAFHNVLAAVVEVYGSLAGKRLWERWCVHMPSDNLDEKELSRLYTFDDYEIRENISSLNPDWTEQKQRRAVIPNMNTIRIIAQAAVQEYRSLESGKPKSSSSNVVLSNNLVDSHSPDSKELITNVLDFCVEKFRYFRLPDKEIDREVHGHLSRMKREMVQ